MANQANAPARVHETVAASHQQIARITQAFVAGRDGIKEAEARLVSAKQSHIERIKQACEGVKAVNEEDWDRHWKPVVGDELAKAGYKKESVNVTSSNIKVAVIAITNGINPKPDDTFTSFVKWAREECKAREYIVTNGAGRKGGGGGETQVTRKPSPKEEALHQLAKCGDETTEEGLRKRVAILRYLIDVVGWEELMKFANQKATELNKPLNLKQAA